MTGLANYYRYRQAPKVEEPKHNPIGSDAQPDKTSVINQTLEEDSQEDSIRFSLIEIEGESKNVNHSLISSAPQCQLAEDSKKDGSEDEKDAMTKEKSYNNIFLNSAFSKHVSSNALTVQEPSEDRNFKVKDKHPLRNKVLCEIGYIKVLKK
eukprot:CAMPEP_0178937972 /NCGR_PEP_ID=MMETSP0786-20121207/26069_1 /TAXON_ID=186022 /ORGANISM="Thalassionema frauenfeldii, Strain CCMP 1798" /LENGTH=151 /DNA_ID=CAMNT_0020616633 /DNA_START=14 /DNA_END=469 /DNA_ORIENTATION=+